MVPKAPSDRSTLGPRGDEALPKTDPAEPPGGETTTTPDVEPTEIDPAWGAGDSTGPGETMAADPDPTATSDQIDGHAPTITSGSASEAGGGLEGPATIASGPVDRDATRPAPAGPDLPRGHSLGNYTLIGQLGRGGMGTVYEAHDRSRNAAVALKVMRQVDEASLHRFKKEFRAHADLSHPNLIRLYELFSWQGRWFFTMERVDGVHFLEAVRGDPTEDRGPSPIDFDRARGLFGQLAGGMIAIHSAGLLHRDIKSSNVLVRPDGRVVILDFGLVAELDDVKAAEGEIVGTIDYMSPEQAMGSPLTASSDWYSFGVLLYEALTGRRPFSSGRLRVLKDKQRFDPPAPSTLRDGIPADLDELCMALLSRRPEARPAGPEVIARLSRSGPVGTIGPSPTSRARPAFVGRAEQLGRLAAAFAESRRGRASAALISGPSGSGKSTLVARFLEAEPAEDGALVLRGRCFEQESVPFKAVDGVAESLAHHLRGLPPEQAESLLPDSAGALPHLLPALGRVAAIDRLRRRASTAHAPMEMRRRAFAAFRGLIGRIASMRPVVIAVDDLQWGDLDGAQLLVDLLLTDPVGVLLVGTYRSGFGGPGACLETLIGALGAGSGCSRVDLAVGPMAEAEARQLAILALDAAGPETLVDAIVREARGDPFAIVELAHQAGSATGRDGTGRSDIGGVLADRIDALPGPTRRLLEVVALAGRPLPQRCAYRAAELEEGAWPALMALRDGKLAISNGLQPDDEVVTAHDRVREAVLGRMEPPSRKQAHRRLALALEASTTADPETIAAHFLGAEESDAAGDYYEAAADRAAGTLAFDRAAKLYDLAADLRGLDGEASRSFRLKHAEALANAGRGGEAGRAYRRLAEEARADGRDTGDLFRRAAYQFTISGHGDDGLAIWRSVLADRGISLPTTPRRTIRPLLGQMAMLKLGGLRSAERPGVAPSAEALERFDVLWAASCGLGLIEPLGSHLLRIMGLRAALRAGEPGRIAIGLASVATVISSVGMFRRRQVDKLLARSADLARRSESPYAMGVHAMSSGFVELHFMRLKASLVHFERAEAIFAGQCQHMIWEGDTCRMMKMLVRVLLCDTARVSGEWEAQGFDAYERGNLYALFAHEVYVGPGIRLARDEPEQARLAMREQMRHWPIDRFPFQHFSWIETEARIDRYLGDGASALARIEAAWKPLSRSMAFRSQLSRSILTYCRGLAAAMAARDSPRPEPLLRLAVQDARRLRRERWDIADAYSATILGAVEARRGLAPEAIAHLGRARAIYRALDMVAPSSSLLRKIGEARGGDQGRAEVAEADAIMTGLGIKAPDRFSRMIVG